MKKKTKKTRQFFRPNPSEFVQIYSENTVRFAADLYGVAESTISRKAHSLGIAKANRFKFLPKEFTDRQRQIIIGSLLGDGCITKPTSSKSNSLLSESHCDVQYQYIKWKADELNPFTSCPPKPYTLSESYIAQNKRITPCTKHWRLETVRHPFLTELERYWYKRDDNDCYVQNNNGCRIKKIPIDLVLTPLTVAVWFMDDGFQNVQQRQAWFCTDCFTFEECNFLRDRLQKDVQIYHCKVNRNDKSRHRICIQSASYLDFMNLIANLIPVECMAYKANLDNYREPNYKPRAKLSPQHIEQIISASSSGASHTSIAKKYRISATQISAIVRGHIWKDVVLDRAITTSLYHHNTSGTSGVDWFRIRNKWRARISINGDSIHLGYYKKKADAVDARKRAESLKELVITDAKEYKNDE